MRQGRKPEVTKKGPPLGTVRFEIDVYSFDEAIIRVSHRMGDNKARPKQQLFEALIDHARRALRLRSKGRRKLVVRQIGVEPVR